MATTLLRDLVLGFADDPGWAAGIAGELTGAIHRELPQLQADEELSAATQASTASVIALFVDRLRRGAPLDDVEPPDAAVQLARELVRRGLPLDALLRSYHIGHATFFERWVAQVHATLDDPVDVARAVEETATSTFSFVRALDSGLVRRWAEERERWVRTTAAARTEIVRAILAGEAVDTADAGRRLDYELAGRHVAIVVWEAEGAAVDPGAVERAASVLADAFRGRSRLIVPLQGRLAAAWVEGGDVAGLRRAAADGEVLDGLLAAIGSQASGPDGFRRSHAEAMDARRVARLSERRAGAIVSWSGAAVAALASTDLERARAFVLDELGSLTDDDDDARRLAATLRVFLEEGMSPRGAARRLGIHENTVANRLKAIEERLGHPVKPRMTELLVALRLAPLVSRKEFTANTVPGDR